MDRGCQMVPGLNMSVDCKTLYVSSDSEQTELGKQTSERKSEGRKVAVEVEVVDDYFVPQCDWLSLSTLWAASTPAIQLGSELPTKTIHARNAFRESNLRRMHTTAHARCTSHTTAATLEECSVR